MMKREFRFFMKASVCSLSGLVAMIFAVNAMASDSSVVLYGVIDEGMDYTNNSGGQSLWHMQDGTYDGVYGSRWGLKGNEDLGAGLSAIFKLESGFSVENGQSRQGGLLFGRQAYMGLSDTRFGTLTFGRQYDSVVDYLQPVSGPGNLAGPITHASDIDNVINSFRVDNSIKYASPKINGLTFGGLYSFTNTNAPGRGTTGLWSVGANYSFNGLNVAAAYLFAKNPAVLLPDGNYLPNTTGSAIGASGPFSYVGSPSNQQVYGIGASYIIGSALVGLDYTDTKFNNANGTTGTVKFDNYEVYARYSFTPSWYAGAVYTYTHGNVGYNQVIPVYQQIGLATSYSLSKQTAIYAMAVWQRVGAGATNAAVLNGGAGLASSNNHQIATRIGFYHLF